MDQMPQEMKDQTPVGVLLLTMFNTLDGSKGMELSCIGLDDLQALGALRMAAMQQARMLKERGEHVPSWDNQPNWDEFNDKDKRDTGGVSARGDKREDNSKVLDDHQREVRSERGQLGYSGTSDRATTEHTASADEDAGGDEELGRGSSEAAGS
jgi:hypothetical protein